VDSGGRSGQGLRQRSASRATRAATTPTRPLRQWAPAAGWRALQARISTRRPLRRGPAALTSTAVPAPGRSAPHRSRRTVVTVFAMLVLLPDRGRWRARLAQGGYIQPSYRGRRRAFHQSESGKTAQPNQAAPRPPWLSSATQRNHVLRISSMRPVIRCCQPRDMRLHTPVEPDIHAAGAEPEFAKL
jgi:hypothetical protein